MAPSTTCDSAVSPCFHGCPAFLPRHFPPQSPSSHPLHPSLHSKQQPLPWDCSTIPKLQLQATVPSREPAFLSRVCMAPTRIVWFSFHLDCSRSVVSLSALNVSPLTQTISPMWGSFSCFSPPPTVGRSRPTNTPVFPSSSFVLPSFTWVYIFFSTDTWGIHLQTQKCMQNTGWEPTRVPDQWKRIYRPMWNLVRQRN